MNADRIRRLIGGWKVAPFGTLCLSCLTPLAFARPDTAQSRTITDGTVTFVFDRDALDELGIAFVSQGELGDPESVERADSTIVGFPVEPTSFVAFAEPTETDGRTTSGRFDTCGALLVDRPGARVVVGNLELRFQATGAVTLHSTLSEFDPAFAIFELTEAFLTLTDNGQGVYLSGELALSRPWAAYLDIPDAWGYPVGTLTVAAEFDRAPDLDAHAAECVEEVAGDEGELRLATVTGPDVIVADLQSVKRYDRVGDITSYAVGTTACNLGTERANWISHTNQHPVIIQNLYRLKDQRFEQVGMSWVKHGFYAVSQSLCTPCGDPTDGSQLGVGCSDPYSASLNGVQTNMSPRTLVNGHTGFFNYPWVGSAPASEIERRLQVHDADLDPFFNLNARYFIEGHYVLPDDAAAGNADNNASYREVLISSPSPGFYAPVINTSWNTQRGQSAARAWQDVDPSVTESEIRVPGEGLFVLAAKAYNIGTGIYRFSYAVQNLNSDRAARTFVVPLPEGAVVGNLYFHGPEYHSGEPVMPAAWTPAVGNGTLTWSTQTYAQNPNANALRFDTTYTFSFDTNVEPAPTTIRLDLFKPGSPAFASSVSLGPRLEMIDCNRNAISDACDLDCGAAGCAPPCGESIDCNGNGVPDECEPDCNENGIADQCDILSCPPGELSCADCNGNLVPDECEEDCDGNQVPDDCVAPADSDGDGLNDCFDLCPNTTPPGACVCPPLGLCCWLNGTWCLPDYPRNECIVDGGVPECTETPCRQGCLLGDFDGDGDLDFKDFCAIQHCYSGDAASLGFVTPPHECSIPLDFDGDDDVDLEDFVQFMELCRGPK